MTKTKVLKLPGLFMTELLRTSVGHINVCYVLLRSLLLLKIWIPVECWTKGRILSRGVPIERNMNCNFCFLCSFNQWVTISFMTSCPYFDTNCCIYRVFDKNNFLFKIVFWKSAEISVVKLWVNKCCKCNLCLFKKEYVCSALKAASTLLHPVDISAKYIYMYCEEYTCTDRWGDLCRRQAAGVGWLILLPGGHDQCWWWLRIRCNH